MSESLKILESKIRIKNADFSSKFYLPFMAPLVFFIALPISASSAAENTKKSSNLSASSRTTKTNQSAEKTRLISRAVGEVDKVVITSREVQINYLLERALTESASRFKKSRKLLNPDTKEFRSELNGVFLEWVVYLEAKIFSISQTRSEEIDLAISRLSKSLTASPEWLALKVSDKELRAMIERKLQAKKFIQFKADSSVIVVTDKEAREFYAKNRSRFGDSPYESFDGRIQMVLKRNKVKERLNKWFEVLQRKYKVKSLWSYSS